MNHRSRLTVPVLLPVGILLAMILLINLPVFGQTIDEASYEEGQFIIQLAPGGDVQSLSNAFVMHNLRPVKVLSRRMNIWLFEYDPGYLKASEHSMILRDVRSHRQVELAQFNHHVSMRSTIPNDPSFSSQWNMHNTGQTGGIPDADIDGPEAWDITVGDTTAFGDQIVVAIIDGGCDLNHEDIDYFKNIHEIPGNSIDDDNNGYVDDYDGWDAYDSDGSVPSSSHGTHVAGIAAAIGNNGTGVTGVNWGVKVMPIAGSSTVESIVVEAYGYAHEMRARYNETNGDSGAFVVSTNSSFGVDYGDPADFPIWCAMFDSMGAVGMISAAATANINIDIDVQGDVPTACPSDYLLSVTNTTDDDVKNTGAAYGTTTIDLGAPGTSVYSTIPGNSYSSMTGTSMATPHVCGAVALMYGAACPSLLQMGRTYPDSLALMVKQAIMDGVDANTSLAGITVTGGRLNVYNSLLVMQSYPCGVAIAHTPLPDTRDILNDYEVLCTITSDTGLVADSLLLYYQISSTWYEDTLVATGGTDEYNAYIPAQSPG
ncbi:MAG: S8 family serine peptidase, partial [bacterium]